MNYWHLTRADTSLLFSVDRDRLCLNYIGEGLPEALDLSVAVQLSEPVVPHGELDRNAPALAMPTSDGTAQYAPGLVIARQNEITLQLQLVAVETGAVTTFQLRDAVAGIDVALTLEPLADNVWGWRSTVTNHGQQPVFVPWHAAVHLPLPPRLTAVEESGGFWANECITTRTVLGDATLQWQTLRGRSGHQGNGSLLFVAPDTSEDSGPAISVALEWPGNHRLFVAPTPSGGHAVQAGVLVDHRGSRLAPGETQHSPLALITHSTAGLNGIRQAMAGYGRSRVKTPPQCRLVHFNSWEGSYFDHDESRTKALISAAAALGAERFVLDDGWMAGRTGPGVGLGDWKPCSFRYPKGLEPVAAFARESGLRFGLWVEPEMVTLDARVAQENPSWIIKDPARSPISGRGQYLLDIRLPEVRAYLLDTLHRLIEECHPDYLKWDMNRDYAQVDAQVNTSAIDMTQGWLALVNDFRAQHPEVELEICAAGGGRTDLGSAGLAERFWPTDSLDPIQRFNVLRSISLILPYERLGWHIGATTSSTSGVATPLSTRAITSLLGHPGIELDPHILESGERKQITRWLDFYKANRNWLDDASLLFLDHEHGDAEGAMLISSDKREALVLLLQTSYPTHGTTQTRAIRHLCPDTVYRLQLLNPEDCDYAQHRPHWMSGECVAVSGALLARVGLRQPPLRRNHCALLHFEDIAR